MKSFLHGLGTVCGIAMPIFNIPMIVHIIREKSSENISLIWAIGAWVCILGMLPASIFSTDLMLQAFGVVNFLCFSGVLVAVLYYHPSFHKK